MASGFSSHVESCVPGGGGSAALVDLFPPRLLSQGWGSEPPQRSPPSVFSSLPRVQFTLRVYCQKSLFITPVSEKASRTSVKFLLPLLLCIKSLCIHINDVEKGNCCSYCWKLKCQGQGRLCLGQGVLALVVAPQHVSLQEVGRVLLQNSLHVASEKLSFVISQDTLNL